MQRLARTKLSGAQNFGVVLAEFFIVDFRFEKDAVDKR